ncbi:MAG: hypothetical protein P8M05_10500 [Flavobacteriales bacterium]|nr:hypothetical protein [Flavobacteriales bacterium]
MIKNLIILTLSLIPCLLFYGYVRENGDMNAGGMYLVVLFVPCLIAIIATLGLTELTQKLLRWEKFSYIVPLLLLIAVIFYPTENWRPILAATIIAATIMNFGLTEIRKKKKN